MKKFLYNIIVEYFAPKIDKARYIDSWIERIEFCIDLANSLGLEKIFLLGDSNAHTLDTFRKRAKVGNAKQVLIGAGIPGLTIGGYADVYRKVFQRWRNKYGAKYQESFAFWNIGGNNALRREPFTGSDLENLRLWFPDSVIFGVLPVPDEMLKLFFNSDSSFIEAVNGDLRNEWGESHYIDVSRVLKPFADANAWQVATHSDRIKEFDPIHYRDEIDFRGRIPVMNAILKEREARTVRS